MMKAKSIVTALLLAFVVGSVAYMVVKEVVGKPDEAAGSEAEATNMASEALQPAAEGLPNPAKTGHKVIAYYFHGDKRCPTCHMLETYAEEALQTHFADELASGKLAWKVVNVDRQENGHFIEDFQLLTKSVVLVDTQDGKQVKWKNLERIWDLVDDKQVYLDYICVNAKEFLGSGS
jgi:hypothetical protein